MQIKNGPTLMVLERKCMSCHKEVESTSSYGEVWHESCYQAHKRAVSKTKTGTCAEHAVCRQQLVRASRSN